MVSVVRAQQILLKSNRLNNISWICRRSTSSAPTPTTTELAQQVATDAATPGKKIIAGAPYKSLSIGVPKETFLNEKRVALTPAIVSTLVKKGFTLNVEENAGAGASFQNTDYQNAGAKIVTRNTAYTSNIVLKVRQPSPEVRFFFSNQIHTLFLFLLFSFRLLSRILVYFKRNQHWFHLSILYKTKHLLMNLLKNKQQFLLWVNLEFLSCFFFVNKEVMI